MVLNAAPAACQAHSRQHHNRGCPQHDTSLMAAAQLLLEFYDDLRDYCRCQCKKLLRGFGFRAYLALLFGWQVAPQEQT